MGQVTASTEEAAKVTVPMTVLIESGGMPYDISVKADDGRQIEVTAIKWECDIGDPMPRATLHVECVAARLEVTPTIILGGVSEARAVTLPAGLSTEQVRYLEAAVGDVLCELDRAYAQRARLLRELGARGASAEDRDAMLNDPTFDLSRRQ